MLSKKIRKNSGRTSSSSTLNIPKKKIIENALEPKEHWDDWNDYRDGFRDWNRDLSKIKKTSLIKSTIDYNDKSKKLLKNNLKLKKKEKIRKVRSFIKKER